MEAFLFLALNPQPEMSLVLRSRNPNLELSQSIHTYTDKFIKEYPGFFPLPQIGCAVILYGLHHSPTPDWFTTSLCPAVFWNATPTRDLATGIQLSSADKRCAQEIRRQDERGRTISPAPLVPPWFQYQVSGNNYPLYDSMPFQEPHNHQILGASAFLVCSFNPAHTSQSRSFNKVSSFEPLRWVLCPSGPWLTHTVMYWYVGFLPLVFSFTMH